MKNKEIAEILNEIADFLEIQDIEFKPRAYRTAARNIESLSEDIEDIAERGELEDIEGVGESIAEKITEYLETGEIAYYNELKADLPIDIDAITRVEGVGPKTAKKLYQALGISTLDELEEMATAGKIAELEGFGEKSQQNILSHIELAKKAQERMLLGKAFPIANDIEANLSNADAFTQIDIVGSFRRRRPTVGDIDILGSATDPSAAMDVFCSQKDVKEVLSQGETKSSVIVSGDLQLDLRIVEEEEYGAALVYFTGSKDHNISLRNRAIAGDLKLNEYGLFDVSEVADSDDGQRVGELVAGQTEEEVYTSLDLEWIPPELREDTGEIEAAADGELPALIGYDAIQGDLQVHTEYSDGSHSVAEMAEEASTSGLEYILITDHGPGAPIPSKLDHESFIEQREEIDSINDDSSVDVTVLQGVEAEITQEGIVIPEEWWEQCDIVVAALHSRIREPTSVVREAFEEAPIDIFAHPTNRLINEREPIELELDAVAENAAANDIAIEINAQPSRLDLDWSLVKKYREMIDFVISTDAHTRGELGFMHLGIAQARRGWCEASDVLNTQSVSDLVDRFNS